MRACNGQPGAGFKKQYSNHSGHPLADAALRRFFARLAKQQRLQLASAVQRDHVVITSDMGLADEYLRHTGGRALAIIFSRAAGSVSIRTSVQLWPLLLRKFLAATQYGQIAVV